MYVLRVELRCFQIQNLEECWQLKKHMPGLGQEIPGGGGGGVTV